MKILIQKFGGTSVATKERRAMVVQKVKSAKEQGFSPVVVVSAMGRKGDSYATDTLLSLINSDFKNSNLKAADMLLSCGEIISSVVMANDLYDNGIESCPLTGGQAGIITDNNFNDAEVLNVDTKNIISILKEGVVPVVTGFQGLTEDGYFTTLGRGASDFSASLLGVALKAEEIQIYTDVDGIMTADPRLVEEAYIIDKITYNEVFQFADQGAKVIHPRAVEMAMKGNIPLVIKNTMTDAKGTLIDNYGTGSSKKLFTGLTYMNNRIQVRFKSDDNRNNDNYYNILDILAENNISIDLINIFPNEQIFTIDEICIAKLKEIVEALKLNCTYSDRCTKVALIGNGIKGVPGVMAKIIKVLKNNNIEVLQTSDSHTTIWCLVHSSDAKKALNIIHDTFMVN
ncbi:aspartate kinase [Clostridium cadaveris]